MNLPTVKRVLLVAGIGVTLLAAARRWIGRHQDHHPCALSLALELAV